MPSLSKNDPPPPSYDSTSNIPLVVSETTVTTTTTTTTTRMFSFPMFRKRINSRPSTAPTRVDAKVGSPKRLGSLLVDKELPPTPADVEVNIQDFGDVRTPPPGQTTFALAQASLGLGLSHTLPKASKDNMISSVVLASSCSRPTTASGPASSPSKPQAVTSTPSKAKPPVRTRGISLGFRPTTPVQERQSEEQKTSLSRRPSFWSRRKSKASAELTPVDTPAANLAPLTLPALPPVSPFNVDTTPGPSGHRRGLSRSHSERTSRSKLDVPPDPKPTPTKRTRRPTTADGYSNRASSKSLRTTSSRITLLPSPSLESPTPARQVRLRPRASTNPPLLNRLSISLGFSPSPPTQPLISNSPRQSLHLPKTPPEIPKPHVDRESPDVYLTRLVAAVSKAEVAGILASSGDPFHVCALRSYIEQFDFTSDPLDVALRKLLMEVGLPRETQQIDRVMEAFAGRYVQCNPGLFISDDHPYILAFSLIMLHTDAFNKSNKRKMTKADYVKNARLPGVQPEILEYYYDNIVFAPFIFIEDPLDVNGQRGLIIDQRTSKIFPSSLDASISSATTASGSSLFKSDKVDPYYLIQQKQLSPLRVNVEAWIPLTNPYSFEGPAGPWNEEELRQAFTSAMSIEVNPSLNQPSPFFGLSVGGVPNTFSTVPPPEATSREVLALRVTKVGTLNRKDYLLEGSRKNTSRKWRQWSVVLTGSQLLLFRDPFWATALLEHPQTPEGKPNPPRPTILRPDEFISMKGAVAAFDRTYVKHPNTFLLALSDGRQILFQTTSTDELIQWISRINYASAFKSNGIRMRAQPMSHHDARLTGIAAAASHLHDIQHSAAPRLRSKESREVLNPPSNNFGNSTDMDDPDVPVAPEVEGAEQFEITFDQVKAELASGRWTALEVNGKADVKTPEPPVSLSNPEGASPLTSRSEAIRSKLRDIDARMSASKTQLDADLAFAKNIAIATPFQRSTQTRLALAVQTLATRIAQIRLEITRFKCYKHVLLSDIRSEEREWERAKKMALRVAAETLQSKLDEDLPRMTLSFHHTDAPTDNPLNPVVTPKKPSSRRQSSVAESFHSALDFGPDWPASTEELDSSVFLSPSQFRGEVPSRTNSLNSHFEEMGDGRDSLSASSPSRSPRPSSELRRSGDASKEYERLHLTTEEPEVEAEEWDKTRCAKKGQRVSLVRLPSGMGLASLFERHHGELVRENTDERTMQ